MKQIESMYFCGSYFIGDPENDQYLMLDINKKKVRQLNDLQFAIIGLLKEIEGELSNV